MESMSMTPIKPFTPQEAAAQFRKEIPSFVIEAVNELLSEECADAKTSVTLLQKDVVDRIMKKGDMSAKERQSIWDKGYLNFETIYAEYGWYVKYDKPGYNESYEPRFKFTPKEK